MLDAFAGSGALGLELLSRGAEHAVFSISIGCVRCSCEAQPRQALHVRPRAAGNVR
ncbi:MAG: RsmD family RNA methyltransferase [Collinsella sp.]